MQDRMILPEVTFDPTGPPPDLDPVVMQRSPTAERLSKVNPCTELNAWNCVRYCTDLFYNLYHGLTFERCSAVKTRHESILPSKSTRLSSGNMKDWIAEGFYDKYSADPSIRPICTRCCFTTTNMIQACSDIHWARVCITNAKFSRVIHPASSDLASRSWFLLS